MGILREEWHSEIQQKAKFVHFTQTTSPVKGLHQLKTSKTYFRISPVVSHISVEKGQLSSSVLVGEVRYKVILRESFEIKISYDLLDKQ